MTKAVLSAITLLLKLIEPVVAAAKAFGDSIPFVEAFGYAVGALLAVLVQNAIFAAASKAIASIGVAAASGKGPIAAMALALGKLKAAVVAVNAKVLAVGLIGASRAALKFVRTQFFEFIKRTGLALFNAAKIGLGFVKALGLIGNVAVVAAAAGAQF